MVKRSKIDIRGLKKGRSHDNHDQAFPMKAILGWPIIEVDRLGGLVYEC
jgi:hypothetical protein